MNVQELKIYYKKAWLSWFFFPRGLKIALEFIPINKSPKDYDAYDRIHQRGVCEWFAKGLQEKGIFSWIFKKLYKKQIEAFSQNEVYKAYVSQDLTESAKLDIASFHKPTLTELLIAAEKDNNELHNYMVQKDREVLAKWGIQPKDLPCSTASMYFPAPRTTPLRFFSESEISKPSGVINEQPNIGLKNHKY